MILNVWEVVLFQVLLGFRSAGCCQFVHSNTKGDGASKNAKLSASPIYLNGELIELTAYNIGGNNYFKLRDLGQAFDFDVSWDNEAKTIAVETYKSYTTD